MTVICLVRHGETDWNAKGKLQGREDVPLNSHGEAQAMRVGEYLQGSLFAAVFTSPLLRAKETALIVNHYVGHLPLIVSDKFTEKSYGAASGMTVDQRDRHFPDGRIPGMEPFERVAARVSAGLADIKGQYPHDSVLLVAHGGLINVILSLYSDGKIGTGKTKLYNTCISHIRSHGRSWEIIDYNRIDHLQNFGKVTSI
ncbi:MAG: histidine phosphatase family protein [Sporolactobacillus sp.]|jgi:uncharacterized phosphatase|nr:histidine phosphatase family protein [Sporolactobacillus sp.]